MTQKRTLWGGGALQVGDLRLLEDGCERGGTLISDAVASETASEEWGGDGERVGVSMGADRSKGFDAGGALEVSDVRLVEDGGERSGALGSDVVASETASEGWGGDGERVDVSRGADKKVGATVQRGESRLMSLMKGLV